MKPSDEKNLGRTIIAAQERLRLNICRSGLAAPWHLEKATRVASRPRLLSRVVPHLERDEAKQYLALLPGWIEQTKEQDLKCAELWSQGAAGFETQQKHLIAMLLRFDFSLRSYERLARQPMVKVAEGVSSNGDAIEGAPRLSAEDYADVGERIAADLERIDQARGELMAAHDNLIEKLVQKSNMPLPDATLYARHGLLKAAENFDVRRGYRFAAYAQKWIKAAIKAKMKCDA